MLPPPLLLSLGLAADVPDELDLMVRDRSRVICWEKMVVSSLVSDGAVSGTEMLDATWLLVSDTSSGASMSNVFISWRGHLS